MERGQHDLRAIARMFRVPGDFVAATPYGSGHINDTYCVHFSQAGAPVRYIFQRLNPRIFKDPVAVMENIGRVTSHARQRLQEMDARDVSRRVLTLVLGRDGLPYAMDGSGGLWRGYLMVEGATGHDRVTGPEMAREAARAFGAFQGLLADLPGGRLHETVPDFHDTVKRFQRLREVVAADPHGRAGSMEAEIGCALEREGMASRLLDAMAEGSIPERVIHNDTKINNVLIDDTTGEGICVIDLDTVMPGCALYDFGDMVRSATNSAAEEDGEPGRVECRMDIFAGLAEGYLEAACGILTAREKAELVFSGRLLTLECGVRFLTDYLEGDVYFKIKRPEHNRDRCRNQFALLRSMEVQEAVMEACVAGFIRRMI